MIADMSEHERGQLVQALADEFTIIVGRLLATAAEPAQIPARTAASDEQIRLTPEPCVIHTTHTPNSHVNERHHIWPKGKGGPDLGANLIVVCATGHNNIHELLKFYELYRGDVPYSVLRTYSRGERSIAKLGHWRITHGTL